MDLFIFSGLLVVALAIYGAGVSICQKLEEIAIAIRTAQGGTVYRKIENDLPRRWR